MNKIWERVLANSFSEIHKSKIICSAVAERVQRCWSGQWRWRLHLPACCATWHMASQDLWYHIQTELQSSTPSTAWPTLVYMPPNARQLHVLCGRVSTRARQPCAETAPQAAYSSTPCHAGSPNVHLDLVGHLPASSDGHVYLPTLLTGQTGRLRLCHQHSISLWRLHMLVHTCVRCFKQIR